MPSSTCLEGCQEQEQEYNDDEQPTLTKAFPRRRSRSHSQLRQSERLSPIFIEHLCPLTTMTGYSHPKINKKPVAIQSRMGASVQQQDEQDDESYEEDAPEVEDDPEEIEGEDTASENEDDLEEAFSVDDEDMTSNNQEEDFHHADGEWTNDDYPSYQPLKRHVSADLALLPVDIMIREKVDLRSTVSAPVCLFASNKTIRICEEIYSTEMTYVKDLVALQQLFFCPIREYASIHELDLGNEFNSLCSSLDVILCIHQVILNRLHASIRCTESPSMLQDDPSKILRRVCTVFTHVIEYMKVYSFYCAFYLQAKESVRQLSFKDFAFDDFTQSLYQTADTNNHVDIVSNLIKPVQRICRYPLLFRELLKTVTCAEDLSIIGQTLKKIENISTLVNEKVREIQNNTRLYELYKLSYPHQEIFFQPARHLMYEIMAFVDNLDVPKWSFLTATHRLKIKPMSLILLTDVLVMAKRRENTNRLKIKRQICLSCAILKDIDEKTFQLNVSKVHRCNCHQQTSAKKPTSTSTSIATSITLRSRLERRRKATIFSASLRPSLRVIKRYAVSCLTAENKKKFFSLLNESIQKRQTVALNRISSTRPRIRKVICDHQSWWTLQRLWRPWILSRHAKLKDEEQDTPDDKENDGTLDISCCNKKVIHL
jgi:hypothetical protein